jgi:hypothetical protein
LWGQSLHSFDSESHCGAHRVALEAVSKLKTQTGAKLHMYYFILTLTTLMYPRISIRVVTLWCDICTDPVLECVNNPEGLNYGDLLDGVVPELTSWLTV